MGKRSPLSDVDIGVVFKTPPQGRDTRSEYQSLYEIFLELYPKSKMDIVLLQMAPLSLQYSVIREGKILFEADPVFRADYENTVINQYLDFRPILDYFDQIATERYAKT